MKQIKEKERKMKYKMLNKNVGVLPRKHIEKTFVCAIEKTFAIEKTQFS